MAGCYLVVSSSVATISFRNLTLPANATTVATAAGRGVPWRQVPVREAAGSDADGDADGDDHYRAEAEQNRGLLTVAWHEPSMGDAGVVDVLVV